MNPSNMTQHQRNVSEFHKLKGDKDPDDPTVPDLSTRKLRAQLIIEEAREAIEAMGFRIGYTPWDEFCITEDESGENVKIEEVAKELADLEVVTTGSFLAFGVEDKNILNAVDENNLQKFGPGSYEDQNGKWIKPPGHKKPNIKRILENQKEVDEND